MDSAIDRFIPLADVRELHETVVKAPAEVLFDAAYHFNLQSIALVRCIFWLRAKVFRTRYQTMHKGIVEETLSIGWRKLACTPGREVVMGAVTQPWVGDVKFQGLPPDTFTAFSEPGFVRIAWTLEAEPLGPGISRFRTQTRVASTDEHARKQFRRYWSKFGIGILMIRRLCVPAVKKEAERRFRLQQPLGKAAAG